MDITLPDGTKKQFSGPVTGAQVAESIGPGLLRAAVAVEVDGQQQDLSDLIETDAVVRILTLRDEEGLEIMRHTITAQILARAVRELYPGCKLAIGPTIANGFYYDVEFERPLVEDELPQIEARMKQIVKEHNDITLKRLPRAEAIALFEGRNEPYKVEIIEGAEDQELFQIYFQEGTDFVDLCRGPHLPSLRQAGAFKLTKLSGAYWRGDSQNTMLTRIYGTAFADKKSLKKHLAAIAEAEKRDHRRVGQQLDLFMFHDYAPGAPFWLPKGEDLYHTLSEVMRSLLLHSGYSTVRTPMLFDKTLWETSGHWGHYQENMFSFSECGHNHGHDEEDEDGRVMSLKPMNCPSHMLIFGSKRRSYRELPMRIHDQGVLHRNELRGALGGLTRVRQFCQDDAHIFCTEEQIQAEVLDLLKLVKRVYSAFDLGFQVKLSTRPEKKLGDDALWDRAEGALQSALQDAGMEFQLKEGDGAFYGPKIDFDVLDALGRDFQCATIQLDFQLPRRFELTYIGADNAEHTPVVIHRAIFGSFERFIAILIDHYAGSFPVWMAPRAVRVMTVSEKSLSHGEAVLEALLAAGVKADGDFSNEKIGRKIRDCHGMKVPYMAIVGEKELEQNTVSIRARDSGDLGSMPLADFVSRLVTESKPPLGRES